MIRNEQDYELDLNLNIQFCLFSVILTINNELWRFSIKLIKSEMHNVNGERERISYLQNLEERESGQTEGTTTERDISRKRSLEEREPQIGGESEHLVLYLKLRV